jgi:hypothetical protein
VHQRQRHAFGDHCDVVRVGHKPVRAAGDAGTDVVLLPPSKRDC